MSRSESIKEKINQIEGKLRFFRNAILALLSGLIWSIYAILEKKAGKEIVILSGVGIVIAIVIFLRIKSLEAKQEWLIEELEKE